MKSMNYVKSNYVYKFNNFPSFHVTSGAKKRHKKHQSVWKKTPPRAVGKGCRERNGQKIKKKTDYLFQNKFVIPSRQKIAVPFMTNGRMLQIRVDRLAPSLIQFGTACLYHNANWGNLYCLDNSFHMHITGYELHANAYFFRVHKYTIFSWANQGLEKE